MTDEEKRFAYGGRSYQIVEEKPGVLSVYRRKREGLEPVHGVSAFRIISAYRQKVEGIPAPRKP
ncbi:MAG: hypothetical protein KC422_12395, partial [Trueperaceae bacterium]|nr:hypothetical protein [Trueperaceae bacterium]